MDFTERYTDGSGSFYHLAHLIQNEAWYLETSVQTGWFGFDNRNGSTAADKTSALLLTQVIGDGYNASLFVHSWGGFKDVSSSWTTYYYKHITFNANGGTGSMAIQEIENNGTLTANAFTRDGYVFVGWKDANGTFYRNKASVTATESDKGPVTLYAQWVSQAEMEQYVGKVIATDGKLYKTVAAATNAGTTASGVVAYWGVTGSVEASSSDYRGLAVSTGDVATYIPWCTDPSGWFAGSTLAQALDARNGWERTNSFGREGSRDVEDVYGHHHNHAAAAAAYDYSVSRPAGSSPWFVPTMGQWNLAAQGLTGSTGDISDTKNLSYTYSTLSTKLTAAGASGLTWAVYWSSTEVDGTNMWTFCVEGDGSEALAVPKTLDAAEFVRTFFAFESAIPAIYTISYDANGGSGAPDAQTKDGGINLTLSNTVPTRTGYTFAGWATTSDGAVAYAAGATYTGNADQTLYAQWIENTATLAENTDNSEWLSSHYGDVYDITLTRTLQTGGWNTFSVPFSMANPSGWTVKKLTDASYDDGTKTLSLTFGDAASIEAGHAYLVKVDANVANPTYNDVEIVDDLTATTILGVLEFVPAINPTALPTGDKSYLFVSGGNKLTWASSGSSMKGFRAYFHILDNDIANARAFSMSFGNDDGTGIVLIDNGPLIIDNEAAAWYTLDGRKVGQPTQKGVYVVNGKKVIIK